MKKEHCSVRVDRVANGWIIFPSSNENRFAGSQVDTEVARTPEELGKILTTWAKSPK